jgi:hypothetical protein
MPRYPKKSIFVSTQQTFPCPVQGCRTQVRSHWGFTQHVQANHSGMDLQYPGTEDRLGSVQFPSSDVDETSSPPPSPNPFSQDEANIHFRFSDWGPSDINMDGNRDTADLDSSDSDLGNEQSVPSPSPADSTEIHPFINGMYINCVIYIILLQLLNDSE